MGKITCRRAALQALAAALLAGCTAPGPPDAATALRPYYHGLTVALPVAPVNRALDTDKPLRRIAFGSCLQQDLPATALDAVAATRPDLFLMIGDNVYGDVGAHGDAAMPELLAAYSRLAGLPEFARLRAAIPMRAVWDDHDFGQNDGGGDFAFKEWAERQFETFWDSSAEVRARPGVYDSLMAGPPGQRVQIILLDTRFFRSPLKRQPYGRVAQPLGPYAPDGDPAKTMLGDAQWRWLERELRKPADVRLILSSIQIVADGINFERWGNFPRERQRLYDLIRDTRASGVVLLSGDRHLAGIYREEANVPYVLTEVTGSSFNLAFGDEKTPDEPVPQRIGASFRPENFVTLDFDWAARAILLQVRDSHGAPVREQRLMLQDLQSRAARPPS